MMYALSFSVWLDIMSTLINVMGVVAKQTICGYIQYSMHLKK